MSASNLLSGRNFTFFRRPASESDGGTIFDDRVIKALISAGAELTILETKKLDAIKTFKISLSRQTPLKMSRYGVQHLDLSETSSEEIIISHEGLAHLLPYLGDKQKVWIIFHNLPSAFDDEGRYSRDGILNGMTRSFERYIFKRPNTGIILLSKREINAVKRSHPDAPLSLLAPGMPGGAADVDVNAPPAEDIVFSGTYDWALKARDCRWLSESIIAKAQILKQSKIGSYSDFPFEISGLQQSSCNLPGDGRIRLGLIPDRFLSGFKLKVLWYIANNCLVGCPRILLDEFEGIESADKFIFQVKDSTDLEHAFRRLRDCDPFAFSKFKSECFRTFDWDAQTLRAFGA